MTKLTMLPTTQFSGLEYNNIINDIQQLILQSPDYNASWDNFAESNAGRILIELFAWITDQLATRIDWVANENFVSTATQRKSIIRLLSLIGYRLSLTKAAKVDVLCVADNFYSGAGEKILLTKGFSGDTNYIPFSLTATDKNGGTKNFEAINYDNVNGVFLYTEVDMLSDPLGKRSLSQTVSFYEGTTKVEVFNVTTADSQIFNLSYSPIINNSVTIYRAVGTTIEKLLEVTSFLDAKAQKLDNSDGTANPIPYILQSTDNNSIIINFGSINILTSMDRRPSVGDVIYAVYRIGGGILGNISSNSINTIKTFTTNLNNIINYSFNNLSGGAGGQEVETTDSALYNGPLALRTAQKTVTKEDYQILLNMYSNVLKAQSYGLTNVDINYYDRYKIDLNPYEVWNFICLQKAGWDTIPTSDYNLFNWVDLKLENRFNETITFGDGEFNKLINYSSSIVTNSTQMDANGSYEYFYNYVTIVPDIYFANNLLNNGLLSNNYKVIPFNSFYDTVYFSDLISSLQQSKWFLNPADITQNYITTNADAPNYKIIEKCNAEIFGNVAITTFSPTASISNFDISIDGRSTVGIIFDTFSNYTITQNLPNLGVVDTINTAISLEYHGLDSNGNLNPYAVGYHNVGIAKTVGGVLGGVTSLVDLTELHGKTCANFMWALNSGVGANSTDVFYLKMRVKTLNLDNSISSTDYNLNFTLDDEIPTSEITTFVISDSNIADYLGKYFIIYDRFTPYLVWIDTTGIDVNPVVANFTTSNSIRINISGASGIDGIGTAFANALTTAAFAGSFNTTTDTLTVTVNQIGSCTIASSGNLSSSPVVISGGFIRAQIGMGEGVAEYPIYDSDGITIDDASFERNSFQDITTLLNRRLQYTFELNVQAELKSFAADSEVFANTCYDIRFSPLPGSNAISVEIFKDDTGHIDKDLIYLLTEHYRGLLELPRNRPYGDYRNVASSYPITSNGITSYYLKLISPNTDKDSSIVVYPVSTDTSFTYLTGIEHPVISLVRQNIFSLGYRKFTFVTTQTNPNFGNFILELNIPKIPFYYDKGNIYLNYVSNSSSTAILGNTSIYRTPNTLNYVYNTTIKQDKTVDNTKTNYFVKFTKNKVLTNSLYAINSDINLVSKNNILITTAANDANLASRIAVCHLNTLTMAIDFANDSEAAAKTFSVDLSSCNGTKEVISLIVSSGCTASGNISIKLRDITTNVSVVNGDSTSAVAAKVAATSFPNWVITYPTNGNYSIVSFTALKEGILSGLNSVNYFYVSGSPPVTVDTGVRAAIATQALGTNGTMLSVYNKIFAAIEAASAVYTDGYKSYIQLNSDGSISFNGTTNTDSAAIRLYFSNSGGTPTGNGDASIAVLFGEFVSGAFNGLPNITGTFSTSGNYPVLANNYYTLYSIGDFSIIKTGTQLQIVKSINSTMPDVSFYVHYINDRRHDTDALNNPILIDEDFIKAYLENYKIMGIENTIKQPLFIAFDIAGTIHCNNLNTTSVIQASVETAIRNAYSLNNSSFANTITKSEIFALIQGIVGVRYAEITYLGVDATDLTTNQNNTLTVGFDEISVISDNLYDVYNNKIHGILFNYVTT